MAVHKIKSESHMTQKGLCEASEGTTDYVVLTMVMDVAIPKGVLPSGASVGTEMFDEISAILKKHGYKMAGDFIDVRDEGMTDVYKNDGYEFFAESLKEGSLMAESYGDTKVRGHVTTWNIHKTENGEYLVTPGNKTYPTLEKAKWAIKVGEDRYVKANPNCKVANKEIWADHGILWITDVDGGYYRGESIVRESTACNSEVVKEARSFSLYGDNLVLKVDLSKVPEDQQYDLIKKAVEDISKMSLSPEVYWADTDTIEIAVPAIGDWGDKLRKDLAEYFYYYDADFTVIGD